MALDFDENESPDEITSQGEELGLKFNILHHSFSSTPECIKLRGIIFLEEEITDFETARLYSSALAHSFKNADKQCVDVARLYFGSGADCIVSVSRAYRLGLSVLKGLADSVGAENFLVKGERNISKPDEAEWGDSKTQRLILSRLSSKKRAYITKKVLGILKDIEEFDGSKGSRYECVWRGASRLARMPEVVGSAVHQWTLDAIAKNDHFKGWDWDAEQVVMSAIEWSSGHADEPV
jgi:hypothetical protein